MSLQAPCPDPNPNCNSNAIPLTAVAVYVCSLVRLFRLCYHMARKRFASGEDGALSSGGEGHRLAQPVLAGRPQAGGAVPEGACFAGTEMRHTGARPPVRSYTRCQYKIVQQWVPRFKSAQDKTIRDLGAVESACHAYTKNYVFPTTDKSNA